MIEIDKGLLSKELKDEISATYSNSVKEMGDSQFFYIEERIHRKLRILKSPGSNFLEISVASLAEPMWLVLKEEKERILFSWSRMQRNLLLHFIILYA